MPNLIGAISLLRPIQWRRFSWRRHLAGDFADLYTAQKRRPLFHRGKRDAGAKTQRAFLTALDKPDLLRSSPTKYFSAVHRFFRFAVLEFLLDFRRAHS
jgi:site-specific recombinase XerD